MADCICRLCVKNIADKKGSHIIPNFLLQTTFGVDGGRSRRNKEVIVGMGLTASIHVGREVLPEEIEKAIGRELSEHEIDTNPQNLFVRDYYYCSECEKKFAVIESYYAKSLLDKYPTSGEVCSNAEPIISLLFWLSVIWRISDSDIYYKLGGSTEQHYRKILNSALHLDIEVVKSNKKIKNKLNKIGYYLLYFEINDANKNYQMGVSLPGINEPKFCDIFQIGTYFLIFYPNKSKLLPKLYGIERDLNLKNYNSTINKETIICFNGVGHEYISLFTNQRAKSSFIRTIQELVLGAYEIECSEYEAISILTEFYKPIKNKDDIFSLSEDRLLAIIRNKYEK